MKATKETNRLTNEEQKQVQAILSRKFPNGRIKWPTLCKCAACSGYTDVYNQPSTPKVAAKIADLRAGWGFGHTDAAILQDDKPRGHMMYFDNYPCECECEHEFTQSSAGNMTAHVQCAKCGFDAKFDTSD